VPGYLAVGLSIFPSDSKMPVGRFVPVNINEYALKPSEYPQANGNHVEIAYVQEREEELCKPVVG
jgi:hypothetical protein